MKSFLLCAGLAILIAGCGRNEPGTMGGEAGTPRTVATGAPADAAKGSAISDSRHSAIESEHASSTFDDQLNTNSSKVVHPPSGTTNALPNTAKDH